LDWRSPSGGTLREQGKANSLSAKDFARYFNRAPDQLGPDHIRQYQAHLFRERKLSPNSVTQRLGGLRFFFIKTLEQSWSAELTPYPKKVLHLPSVLSREEVTTLIESAPTPFQRTLLAHSIDGALCHRQLQNGARSMLPTSSKKPTVTAMEEVRRGLVQYDDPSYQAAVAARLAKE
jgi:hypothetical protein